MNGYWTYTNNELTWESEEFESKQQAIQQAKKEYDTFYVGQLKETDHLVFSVINIEEIKE